MNNIHYLGTMAPVQWWDRYSKAASEQLIFEVDVLGSKQLDKSKKL